MKSSSSLHIEICLLEVIVVAAAAAAAAVVARLAIIVIYYCLLFLMCICCPVYGIPKCDPTLSHTMKNSRIVKSI